MTVNDPTDHALAAIASILDSKESAQVQTAEGATEQPGSDESGTVTTERVTVAVVETETVLADIEAPATAPEPTDSDVETAAEVDGYTRLGPGPLDAIRFRWTARRDEHGQYFVDETIGETSRPVSSGPMPRHEVIGFIEARESAARERFQMLKRQMTIARQEPETVGES